MNIQAATDEPTGLDRQDLSQTTGDKGRGARREAQEPPTGTIANTFQWIIEGDIKGFFDHVDHEKLLAKLAPEDRGFMRRILKAPVMEPQEGMIPNRSGTPQGGLCKA